MLSYRRWSGRSSCDLALPDQRDEFVLSTTGGSPRKTRILVPFFDHVGLLLVNNVSVVLENWKSFSIGMLSIEFFSFWEM